MWPCRKTALISSNLIAVVGVLLGCLLGSGVLFVLTGRLFLSPALLVFLAVTLVSAWPLLK